MPSYESAAITMEALLRASWTTTPIVAQNTHYRYTTNQPFIFFEILNGQSYFASMGSPGNNHHRNVGAILVHVFVPTNTGDGLALTYARQIGDIFKGKSLNEISYGAATVSGGEVADNSGNFWRRTVSIEYRFDETA